MTGFLVSHGYLVLFIVTLVTQLGAPLPLAPLLVAGGVLAREGTFSMTAAIAISVVASALGHIAWYVAGRRRGTDVLRLLCRISIEPDSCVRKTEDLFVRYGPGALVAAPFVPGLGAVAPPLAGMSGMPVGRFLLLDSLGTAFHAAVFLVAGFAVGPEVISALHAVSRLGGFLVLAVGIALGVWLGWKMGQRSRVLRALRIGRVDPADLVERLSSADPPLIVDLRSDLTAGGETIRGAHRVRREDLARWAETVPREREIILACD
ncbi:MAG: VTT domain-containing protein [Myxococcales bacterium]